MSGLLIFRSLGLMVSIGVMLLLLRPSSLLSVQKSSHTGYRAVANDVVAPGSAASAVPLEENIISKQILATSSNASRRTTEPLKLTFYMYRAQSDKVYLPENVNLADLPGVLWYLHNEIVAATPRKYNVSRILRYKIDLQTTNDVFDEYKTQFSPFMAFDNGRCTTPGCMEKYRKYGYTPGCQLLDTRIMGYVSTFQTSKECNATEFNCPAVWYSLPGRCPSRSMRSKDDRCSEDEPGGACAKVTGAKSCTYSYQAAGEIRLDDLSGIEGSYLSWWMKGNKEWDPNTDHGKNCTFWDGIRDRKKCMERVRIVATMFQERYPFLPGTYGSPPCNFS